MERYGGWLGDEGQRAGGIGPSEWDRMESRHLGDSLLFAACLEKPPTEIWDLGSGLGLPGIPLAIALPESRLLLVDRSRRRVDLMRRAIRILGLANCDVRQGEILDLKDRTDVIVSRASLPPPKLLPVVERHLEPGGMGVVAGSWRKRPEFPGWETEEIPSHVLDHPVWLLIMRRE